TGRSALLLGATGATGKHLLRELLACSQYSRVGEYGRWVTSPDDLQDKEKLEQKTIDFEKVEEAGLREGKWDVVYIILGTTRAKAGNSAAFERIDRDYVVNAARAAKSNDPQHTQRLVYLSSNGASPNASLLYLRSKGLTEMALASLGYEETIILRPGFLRGAERGESRPFEAVMMYVCCALLNLIRINAGLAVPLLAKSMRIAGESGSVALLSQGQATSGGEDGRNFTVVGNSECISLS
ncbi:hypothetical protein GLOTRDRAFT_16179, partial [Gloeophyllum trabeum ATCC 11539]